MATYLVTLLEGLVDGDDDDLMRGKRWGEYEAVVIGVAHDERTHQTGRYAPGGSPDELLLPFLVGEGDVKGLGKVLPEEVGSTALKGLTILHQSLDGIGLYGSSEAFVGTLYPDVDRDSEEVACEVSVDIDHTYCLFFGLLTGSVGGVPFLPEELSRAEEEARAHLPADDIRPLIAEDGEVTIGLYPALVGVPDNGLRGRTYDEFLLELCLRVDDDAPVRAGLQTVVGDDSALLSEALDVVGFLAEEALRDEEREVGIVVSCFLEHVVELALHALPYSIAVGLDDHTATHGGTFRQVSLDDEILIPL